MRPLTVLLLFVIAFPLTLSAQSARELLQKVSAALSEGRDDYAVSLFRQSIDAGADQAEMYYWTQVEKNSTVAPRLLNELASHYKHERNYDKAYLFYKEYLQYHSEDVSTLVSCAEMEMMRGKDNDALMMYEKVLMHDANNLQANIFLGNYFYLKAEQDKEQLEFKYKRIPSPTRMQYARYRNELSHLYSNGYFKAKTHLQRVLQVFPSTEAGETLEKIKRLEKEIK